MSDSALGGAPEITPPHHKLNIYSSQRPLHHPLIDERLFACNAKQTMPRNPKLPYTLSKIPEQFATTTSKSAHNTSGQHRRSTNQSTRFQPSNYIAAAMQDSQQSSAPMPNETEPAQNAQKTTPSQ
ncbi:hypothetical protein M758_6G090600 [Ceratodon purpureus]|nr:hypothetical protein M758_6G090600 [Ceratodon purpureus]